MPAPADLRAQLEARLALQGIADLVASPLRGNFDAAHLREVHRRIFEAFPAHGLDHAHPGEYRPQVPGLRRKVRSLETRPGGFPVGYSAMDPAAITRLETALAAGTPDKLRGLSTADFTKSITTLYAEADYVHPFEEGNSRTLRTFTRQLARDSGFQIDWERFNASGVTRDALCIARDKAVLKRLLPELRDERSLHTLATAMHRVRGDPSLEELLKDAVRPIRALAFEKLPQDEALAKHPELHTAYAALQAVRTVLAERFPGDDKAQAELLTRARADIQGRLDAGVGLAAPGLKLAPDMQPGHHQSTSAPER